MAVHPLPVALLDERRRTRLGRLKMMALVAVCAAPVIASYLTYYFIRPSGRSNYGELVSPSRPIPSGLQMTRPDGSRVSAESLKGQWLLVVVSGPECANGCEQRLLLQRQLRETLGREKQRVDNVWLVAGDGAASPATVAAVLKTEGSSVLRVTRDALGSWLTPAPGHQLDEHLYLVDPLGQWMMRMPAAPEPARMKRDLERLLRAASSWDRPGR